MKKELIVIILILLILVLNGCTEMTRSEKNLCITLSSKSYAYLPVCETESSCFKEISTLFKTKLGYEEESELYTIKNHVARSWYFYNLALKEQKKIQNYCKNENVIGATGALNQAQSLISESFYELDLAMKKSFDLIKLEETKFSNEKIDLIKEEKLYSNLIEFRQIVSELNTGTTNSDTYVSYYAKKAKNFELSSASKGFPILLETSPFLIENFDLINNTILDVLGIEKKGYFPFVNDLLKNAIADAEMIFFKKQSLLALQKFPVYEFMKLYSDLGGNTNSSLKRFSDLMNKTSEGYLELNKKIEDLWLINEKNLVKLNELLKSEKSVEEFYPLASKLIEKTITTDSNTQELTKNTLNEFIKLKENKYSSNLTKGEELNKLKNIENSFNEIITLLNFKSIGFEEKLISVCKTEANKEIKLDTNTNTNNQIMNLIEEVKYFASRVKNTNGKECLLSCQELILKKELLNQTQNNILLLESIKKDSLKECITFLEKIFINENLFELKTKFEELKKTEITKDNLNTFSNNCELIKTQVENELKSDFIYENLKNEYLTLKNNLKELNEITFYLNETNIINLNKNYIEKANSFENYFSNGSINFESVSSIKETLLEKLISINKELNQLIEEKIIYYVEKNIILSKLNSEIININEYNLSTIRLIINNPFRELNKEIYLKTNFDFNQIVSKDECVDFISTNLIKLFYLPKGKTKIDFSEETKINSEEVNSFVYATNELSLLERKINLIPKIETQKLLVRTKIPSNTINTVVLVDNFEVLHVNENEETKFIIENIKSSTNIKVLYYLTNVISLNKELIQTKTTELDETLIYKLTSQNNFSTELKANLIITLPSTNAEISVYSQDYTKKEIKKIGNKIIISNQNFLEKESKYFEIWIKTISALDYYKEGLEKQETFFIEHNYLEKAENTKKIREEENIDLMKKLFESNSIEITKIELEEKNKISFELMKQKLLEKIEELRQKQNELYNLGLTSEAEKIGITLDSIIAEKLNSDEEIAKAFDKLVTLSFSADNKLKSEVEKMWENINLKSENNNLLIELKNAFFNKKQLFDEKFSFDIIEANKLFSELQKDYSSFLEELKEIDKNNLTAQKELYTKLNLDLNYCESILNLIEKDLIENNSNLIKSKFIMPLTQSRIEKIRLLLTEIKNSDLNVEEKIKKLEPLRIEVWESNEAIKKQTILAFNKAVDNKASKEILSEGKKLIDENKYVDAYLILFNPSPPTQLITEYSVFLPILLIIIIAFILKKRVNKKENEDKNKKKVIMDEWEKI